MAELAYAQDLGSCGETLGGSNPPPRTRRIFNHEFIEQFREENSAFRAAERDGVPRRRASVFLSGLVPAEV